MHDRHPGARVRPFQSHEWRLFRELRLEALRESPNAFGSTLAREEAFTEQEWITRLALGAASPLDQPLVAEDSGRAVGLAWVRIDATDLSTATLYQVWVHPEYRRRGIGQRLLAFAVAWAKEAGATTLVLSVACGPDSAIEFYRRAGFMDVGKPTRLRPDSDLMQQSMRRTI
jgi:ribosomal protein S18 acetylase RimI-like enzyme